eukprot:TRINITY_DN19062_c0_g2_i1.p1 TRINITY_DN19062_c0_g2~~TRINITY_DN19062_c0_g2_i1.p1  ORF type:complete len:325 (-),score=33.05 TRINITY_DN19062_c0_g2_i1:172-1146(-)
MVRLRRRLKSALWVYIPALLLGFAPPQHVSKAGDEKPAFVAPASLKKTGTAWGTIAAGDGLASARGRPSVARSSAEDASALPAERALEWPSSPFLALMAAAGALLGPNLDGFHSRFGVLRYHDPPPFHVVVGGLEFCETAVWVPPLFGVAGALIGGLYVIFDQLFDTPAEKRAPSLGAVLVGILLFIAQYALSGMLLGTPEAAPLFAGAGGWSTTAAVAFLWVYGIIHWWYFDGTKTGFLVSTLTAVGGPLIEVTLLNLPGWDLYAYASPDFAGIPTWIASVYFCGGLRGPLWRSLGEGAEGTGPTWGLDRRGLEGLRGEKAPS